MTLTLLLDLDDTLLNTNLEAFIPAYFQAFAKEVTPNLSADLVFRALLSGTRKMMENNDFSRTLEDVFTSDFYPQLNLSRGALDSAVNNFYDNFFPTLGNLTSQKPEAKPFVDWAFSQGYRIAIATDPLFPRKATYHRLRWAGFEPEQFELVSSYEHFHFTKDHPAYYAEVLGRLGWPEGSVLMAGNDINRDILPAKRLGLSTYLVNQDSASGSTQEANAQGDLTSLRSWLESVDSTTLIPSFKSRESVMGILLSTPAVMPELSQGMEKSKWFYKFSPKDWSLVELICHLRDTEREIHHMQIKLFKESDEPFIPRPDTSVWASQRDYMYEDGASALTEFVAARKQTIEMLNEISLEEWSRKARHAIFGPTDFLEVLGFMADHDRMHVQQAWNLLKQREK